jgi:hypothetical protein
MNAPVPDPNLADQPRWKKWYGSAPRIPTSAAEDEFAKTTLSTLADDEAWFGTLPALLGAAKFVSRAVDYYVDSCQVSYVEDSSGVECGDPEELETKIEYLSQQLQEAQAELALKAQEEQIIVERAEAAEARLLEAAEEVRLAKLALAESASSQKRWQPWRYRRQRND